MSKWINTLTAIEESEKLIVVAFTKEDVESAADVVLTDEQWGDIRGRFRKYGGSDGMVDFLCDAAREIAG